MGALAIVVCGLFNVQPMCTEHDFQSALGASIEGDHELIARAVFDDYTDRVHDVRTKEDSQKQSQTQRLATSLQRTRQAKDMFDELLESLAVLNNERAWKMGVTNLRRTVLLDARETDNPWPSTVWIDLPTIVTVPRSVFLEIDAFLILNVDDDIEDRYGALNAALLGDFESCRAFEERSMERWANYIKIVEPFINSEVEVSLYPQLATDNQIQPIVAWVVKNIEDTAIVDKVNFQFAMWKTRNAKTKQEAISLIKDARGKHGFDPWSQGCGAQSYASQSQIKNKLLQKTAQMQESADATYKSLLGLLSPKQVHQFEDER